MLLKIKFENMLGKGRFCLVFIFSFSAVFAQVPYDTMSRHGFGDFQEAADTIWSRLSQKAPGSLKKFTVDLKVFTAETRKHDTAIAEQMIQGQWLNYWYHVDRSFKRISKTLKKEKLDAKRAKVDTLLVYTNTGDVNLRRAELYFTRNKKNACIRFEMWRVNGLWYFNGELDFINEPGPVRVR